MGKAIQWFKSLFGIKKGNEKKETPISAVLCRNPATIPPNITEAEATWLTAAEVAVAAAEAAVSAVKVRDGLFVSIAEHLAAVKIQSYFRGYLARKALKGLRAVVKIQALMRGILVRKQAKATLLGMEALIRVQNIVRAKKNQSRYQKLDHFYQSYHGQKVKERSEHITTSHSKRLSYSFDTRMSPFDEKPMAVEVGLARPKSRFRRPNNSVSDSNDYLFCPIRCNNPSRLSAPDSWTSQGPSWALTGDEYHFSTAHSTPHFVHGPKKFVNGPHGSVTPANSLCGGDDVFRRYMADTHSFRAKLRCQSAPRQRPDVRLKKRQSLIDLMENRNSYSGVKMQRSCSKAQDVVQFKSAVMCKLDRSCDSSRKEERVSFSRRKS